MPRKIDPDKKYGEKLIQLFGRLLFSRRPHFLTELAEVLCCSKQTVLRLLKDIENSYQVEIKRTPRGRQATYVIKTRKPHAAAYVSKSEMDVLRMCHAFTERLLGKGLFQEARRPLIRARFF